MIPERFNPVIDILEQWACDAPGDLALVSVGAQGQLLQSLTAAELAFESRRMARALVRLGVRKGDRLMIMLPRVSAWYTAMLGTLRVGAVAMPTPNQCTSRDVAYRIESAQAAAIIADEVAADGIGAVVNRAASIRYRLAWSESKRALAGWYNLDTLLAEAGDGETPQEPTASTDPSLIFFTSGTVSHPKMVLHDQSYALGHVPTARFWHGLMAGDRHWTVSDTGWAKAAWGSLFGQWHERATVLQVNMGKPTAENILSIIQKHQVNSFCAPPTLYRLLVQTNLRAYDLSCLHQCTSAGEPLNPEVIRAWREGTGLTIRDGYGQTETTLLVANTIGMPVRPGSMGKPMPGYNIRIVDDDGRRLAAGQLGQIAVATDPRPIGLFNEYLHNDEATRSVFRAGWYFTGDRAAADEDGYFWFSSRVDDVITSSAYRIGPFEVESALIEHPAVLEAAVVGKEDRERTQIVCAFVILAQGVTGSEQLTRELQDHVKRLTAPYKYPREIYYCQDLPKTISGKIRRSELRQRLHDQNKLQV